MSYKFKNIVLFLFLSLFITNCSHSGEYLKVDELFTNPGQFDVWALADIQPADTEDRTTFVNAVQDVNDHIHGVEIALVAGDIVERANSADYDWYLKSKNSSYIKNFYEIAGNHDLKTDIGELFREKLQRKRYYSVEKGNILFLLLSDEARGKSTTIGDEAFEWWKDQVVNNQDKVIVVVSHAPLDGSGISFSSLEGRNILDSERFTSVMKNYNVDIWLSGHLHLPHAFNDVITVARDLNDTNFIHVSSIRTELLGIKHSESRFLTFYCNTDNVVVRSRDHSNKEWQDELEKKLQVSNKIYCD